MPLLKKRRTLDEDTQNRHNPVNHINITLRTCNNGFLAWDQLLGRPGLNYTLAAIKPRTECKQGTSTTAKAKPKPLPMQDRLLIDNWQGPSKEDLLALPDFLPAGVRDCPRAYLVKPRQTNTGKKNSTFRANEKVRRAKRPRDTEDSVQRHPSNPASTYATPQAVA
ncbi:hypothetical protein D6D11_10500 [Aureobasidium pullulans]|nr:hypothetical protein D6D11_10500 [Aureobasidium pullulans]THX55453.1 hypothetical protein D6D08_09375 [Aureobasidium pullulans]